MKLTGGSVVTFLAWVTCLLACSLVSAEEPKIQIDHIIWAVPDLDAGVELTSPAGTRHLGIDELILGPYFSAREPDELNAYT